MHHHLVCQQRQIVRLGLAQMPGVELGPDGGAEAATVLPRQAVCLLYQALSRMKRAFESKRDFFVQFLKRFGIFYL